MLALALLVCGCVFASLAGPAVSLHLRTEALQQALSRLGALGTAVEVDASWNKFPQVFADQPTLTESNFSLATSTIAGGLAYSLPVAVGWGGLTTEPHVVISGAARLPPGYQPELEVTYRDQLTSYVQTVAGRVVGTAVPRGAVGVTVTQQTAARFGLHPGSRLELPGPVGPVRLLVTAVVRERDPAGTFWTADPLAAAPGLAAPSAIGHGPASWQGAAFADPGQLAAMENAFCPVPGLYCDSMRLRWEFPVAIGGVTADQAQALANGLANPDEALYSQLGAAASELTVTSPMTSTLATFVATQTAVLTLLLLLFVSLISVGLAAVVLAARMAVARREDELIMLRARGASGGQVAMLMLGSAALAAVPAAAAGAVLAIALVPGTSITTSWELAAAVLAVALAGPPLIAVWRHRSPAPGVNPALVMTAETKTTRYSVPDQRRLVAGVTACAVAVAGLVVLHDQGLPPTGVTNWYLTAAPILVAVPAVLIAMRLYPLAIRALLSVWRRRAGVTGYVALASAGEGGTATLPAFALVLALTLAAFCGMVNGTIVGGQIAYSWQTTGADAVITTNGAVNPATPGIEKSIMAIPGVRHSTAVWTTTWNTPAGRQLTVAAVDPAGYAAMTADTPFPGIPVAAFGPADNTPASTATVIPVLASQSAAAALGTGNVRITSGDLMGPIRVRVVGILPSTPAQPAGGMFLIMPLRTLPGALGRPAPNLVLVTGADINQAKLSRLVSTALPAASLTFRADVFSALGSVPMQHAAALLMTLVVFAAAGLALLNLVFGLALSARDRELMLARLSVMGYERDTRLVLLMTLPAVLVAFAAAAGCALALPTLVGPALDLSVFTGANASVSFRPDLAALGVPCGIILLLIGAALTAETRRSRRHGVTGLLRTY